MSAPDTNIETESKRHKLPLVGITFAVAIAVIAGLLAAALINVPTEEQAAPATTVGQG